MVQDHYSTFAIFSSPLFSHCILPLSTLPYLEEGWGRMKTSLLKMVLMMKAVSSPLSREQPAALK